MIHVLERMLLLSPVLCCAGRGASEGRNVEQRETPQFTTTRCEFRMSPLPKTCVLTLHSKAGLQPPRIPFALHTKLSSTDIGSSRFEIVHVRLGGERFEEVRGAIATYFIRGGAQSGVCWTPDSREHVCVCNIPR
jgi:hypothetical protein